MFTLRGVLLAYSLVVFPLNVQATEYTFTKIAETGGGSPYTTFFEPTINNQGVVAFKAPLSNGQIGIFIGDGTASPVAIIDSSGEFDSFPWRPMINDNGMVAFIARPDTGGIGAYISDGTTITPIADPSGPFPGIGIDELTVNNSDFVAYRAIFPDSTTGIFVGDGTTTDTIVLSDNGFVGLPRINDGGAVAYVRARTTGGHDILVKDGSVTTTILDGSIFSSGEGVGELALNNNGTVAFLEITNSGRRIRVGDGTAIPQVFVDDSGFFREFFWTNINDSGTVAFRGHGPASSGVIGVYTGPDPVNDNVIQTGDPLFGSAVSSVSIILRSLNNNGQIAFTASLDDGRSVIGRADPVGEPPSGPPPVVLVHGWCGSAAGDDGTFETGTFGQMGNLLQGEGRSVHYFDYSSDDSPFSPYERRDLLTLGSDAE